MDEVHLPAVCGGWLLAQERWLLLSPNPEGTVAGTSSSSRSVVPSMVTVPALSLMMGYGCCIVLLVQGGTGTLGTPELAQDALRRGSASLCRAAGPTDHQRCSRWCRSVACKPLLSVRWRTRRSVPGALLAFTRSVFITSKKEFISVVCKFFRWLL